MRRIYKPYDRVETRLLGRAHFDRGMSAQECYQALLNSHGMTAPSYASVSRWYRLFRKGNREVSDMPRAGRPRRFTDAELMEALITGQKTCGELAQELNVHPTTIGRRKKAYLERKRRQALGQNSAETSEKDEEEVEFDPEEFYDFEDRNGDENRFEEIRVVEEKNLPKKVEESGRKKSRVIVAEIINQVELDPKLFGR
ncbi:unnamed protein product [Bursaphelenchus xylophilus]|uniref:(pine wood nematode) hypothetical protein n=1 Tax=Bursaphelenchus xylophilus TaxID=6326 RepID=A0A1I7S0W3_BURXY|nr:unnamed protein product [Bursaphelenchus xylophilus]CAG9088136.1 unnamed protein product [Bursaphelenchus xylophilus]